MKIWLEQIKLITFYKGEGRQLTVAALVIKPSPVLIYISKLGEDNIEGLNLPIREAFNNNGPYTGFKVVEYIQKRMAKENDESIHKKLQDLMEEVKRKDSAGYPHQIVSLQTAEDLIPPNFRLALADYVPPTADGFEMPKLIREAVISGKNVFIRGGSGMGKSLLISYCFLEISRSQPSCYYAIDRTQGPDVYKTEVILAALEEQVEGLIGGASIPPPPRDETKALWVWKREQLRNVLKTWSNHNSEQRLIVFLDGLDENSETIEEKIILNVLKPLIINDRYKVAWIMSSQPRQGMDWLKSYFQILSLEGLNRQQARQLLEKYVPKRITSHSERIIDELLKRARMDNSFFDPEMLVMMGKALREKFGVLHEKVRFISQDVLRSFIGDLPLTPREKYPWLFEQYTDEIKLRIIPDLETSARIWREYIPMSHTASSFTISFAPWHWFAGPSPLRFSRRHLR